MLRAGNLDRSGKNLVGNGAEFIGQHDERVRSQRVPR